MNRFKDKSLVAKISLEAIKFLLESCAKMDLVIDRVQMVSAASSASFQHCTLTMNRMT